MADLAVRHLHPDMSAFDQGKPVQPFELPFRYWRVPGDRGLIMHTFIVSVPILIDFAVPAANHAECLDRDILENVYVSSNFADCDRVHVVQDSDEFTLVSLTPKGVNRVSPSEGLNGPFWAPQLPRLCNIRASMRAYAGANGDVVKRDLFQVPIRWHVADLDRVWKEEERRIDRLIGRAVGDYYKVSKLNRKRFPKRRHLLDIIARPREFLLDWPGAATAWSAIRSARQSARRRWLDLRPDGTRKHD
jgi:hypothetical protein